MALRLSSLLILAIAGVSATSASEQTKGTPRACWSPSELETKSNEDQIHGRAASNPLMPMPPNQLPELSAHSPFKTAPLGTVRRVKLPANRKLIALTFDLCELADEVSGYQGGIVDYLRLNGVKATFFAGGRWMLDHGERTQQIMSDPLFEIGNHTFEHHNLRLLSGSALTAEINNTELVFDRLRNELEERQCISQIQQDRPGGHPAMRVFRFPYGACDAQSLASVRDNGLTAIQWDVTSRDSASWQSAETMKRRVLTAARPGSIILFHANGRGLHTEHALKGIVAGLSARGYKFVTVSELLQAGEPVVSPTCYDEQQGDTDRYDELARRLDARAKGMK
jgi:peptidoglycan/xylan/chitin deacetylase (PgdA/CDA1 family)